MKSTDYVGRRYGNLVVSEFIGIRQFPGGGRATLFRFQCDCGASFEAQKSNVVGKRSHCGCKAPKKTRTMPPGSWRHPLYKVWSHMIDRCSNKRCADYKNYGGRGIAVCHRWRMGDGQNTGFECFVADLGARPAGHTIERVNGNGDYEPGNCVWLPKPDQSRNRRTVKIVRLNGKAQTIPQWCEQTGVPYFTAIARIRRGWPPDRAITTPVRGAA